MSKCKISGKVLSIRLGRDETQLVLLGKDSQILYHTAVATPAGAVEAWYNSPPHQFNMLNPVYTSTVVGKLSGLGSVWVQIFFSD